MRTKQLTALFAATVCVVTANAEPMNPVVEWNGIMQDALVGENAPNETRIAAITQLAVFEAVNSITREYRSYLDAAPADSAASVEAAAIAAAYTVLHHYVPSKAALLEAAKSRTLATVRDSPSKLRGVLIGEAAARAMLELRAQDDAMPPAFHLPANANPGEWRLTAACSTAGGVLAHWGNVALFGGEEKSSLRLPPPPPLSSRAYARAYNEAKRLGSRDAANRPKDRADVARFYAAVLAIRTWNPVATQLAVAQGQSLTDTARALALLNMAMSDALVAVFDNKYRYRFWRPETAIRNGDHDSNPLTQGDETFVPLVSTPCHPSYASAHAGAAYAAKYVLERIYGKRNHRIVLASAAVPGIALHYADIAKIVADIDDARIYGGIHFRFDQEAGAKLGQRVGRHVYRHNLRRAQVRDDDDQAGN